MKLELNNAEIEVFFVPNDVVDNNAHYKGYNVDILMARGRNKNILRKMDWSFSFEVIDPEHGTTVMFSTNETMIEVETMLALMRGYFAPTTELELDPVSWNAPGTYMPSISVHKTVFFDLKVIRFANGD